MNTIDGLKRFIFLLGSLVIATHTQAQPLKVLYIKGDTQFKSPEARTFSSLRKSQKVPNGSIISTGKNSLALLKNKAMTIKVMQSSLLKIDTKLEQSDVSLQRGGSLIHFLKKKRRASGAPELRVKTKTASIGVRGTTFMVYTQPKKHSILSVKEGTVDFQGHSSQSALSVETGKTTMTNQMSQNLRPRNFGLQKLINWNLSPDKPLSQREEFFSAAEQTWQQYKSEQEFIWKQYKNEQEQKWKNFINN